MGVLTTHLPEITKEQITNRIEKMRNYALLSKKCKKKCFGGDEAESNY